MARECLVMVIITVFDFTSYNASAQISRLERLLKICANKALKGLNQGWVHLLRLEVYILWRWL